MNGDVNMLTLGFSILANIMLGFVVKYLSSMEGRIEKVEKDFHLHAENFKIHTVQK